MSSLSGFISSVFGVLLTISLTLAVVYWQEKKMRRAKTRGAISVCCAVITVIAYGFQYFTPPQQPPPPVIQQTTIGPPEKPYVHISDASIELQPDKSPVVNLMVRNGPADATVVFSEITFRFTRFLPDNIFEYDKLGTGRTLKLAPHETVKGRWISGNLRLSQREIDALMAEPPEAALYIFARAEYTDETGKHPLYACWRYDKDFEGHLVYCREDIKLK
jgi:hypothetical protein